MIIPLKLFTIYRTQNKIPATFPFTAEAVRDASHSAEFVLRGVASMEWRPLLSIRFARYPFQFANHFRRLI